MYKLVAVIFVVLLSAGASRLQAQSLKNTAWKFYVEPLHDSLIMHIGGDTSYTTTSSGETVVRSLCKVDKETVKIKDFAGEYNCPDGEGIYKYTVEGDVMTMILVNDPCPNRSNALNGVKFVKAAVK